MKFGKLLDELSAVERDLHRMNIYGAKMGFGGINELTRKSDEDCGNDRACLLELLLQAWTVADILGHPGETIRQYLLQTQGFNLRLRPSSAYRSTKPLHRIREELHAVRSRIHKLNTALGTDAEGNRARAEANDMINRVATEYGWPSPNPEEP